MIESESALKWLIRVNEDSLCLRTGHQALDALLGNSLPLRGVSEIFAESGIGKIELVLTIVARLLSTPTKGNWMVVVLDYNGTFRTDRLLNIIERLGNVDHEQAMIHLNRVLIKRIYSTDELKSAFTWLVSELSTSSYIPLVVVNEIGAILSDVSFQGEQEGTFELDQVLSIMRKFCTVCGAAVITTNHVVDWRGYAAPALGNAWISAIGTRVFLEYLEKCPDASGAADHSYELLATVINKQVASSKVPYKISNDFFEGAQ